MDGTRICDELHLTEGTANFEPTREKVKQTKPNGRSWKLFYDVLRRKCSRVRYLTVDLGGWTDDHSCSGKWRYYESDGRVYENRNGFWQVYDVRQNVMVAAETISDNEFDYKNAWPADIAEFTTHKQVVPSKQFPTS